MEIGSGAFLGLNSLENLLISDATISKIMSGAFLGLSNLRILKFQNTQIETIQKRGFAPHSLISLIFDSCTITNFESEAFSNFSVPKIPHLANLSIRALQPGTFLDFHTHTVVLNLSHNKIEMVQSNTFESFERLKGLFLDYNRIHRLESDSFSFLINLLALHISNNRLENIPINAFVGLLSLQLLDLSHNQLQSTVKFVLPSDMHTLNLSYNNITHLVPRTFAKLSNLKILDLSNNFIHTTHKDVFTNLENLDILDLSYNEIDNLDLSQLKNLFRLRVNSNNLRRLNADELLRALPNLKDVSLQDNNFICTEFTVTMQKLLAAHVMVRSTNCIWEEDQDIDPGSVPIDSIFNLTNRLLAQLEDVPKDPWNVELDELKMYQDLDGYDLDDSSIFEVILVILCILVLARLGVSVYSFCVVREERRRREEEQILELNDTL
ncbi:hypothetical protein RI129_011091 [Pyrocoelia pectoralis]|uniref:Uncharacterized protein n=1 Tax=Pyrocoelia pectoralis TaxID=417401 RepID=A0AAN7ZA83_9COLE